MTCGHPFQDRTSVDNDSIMIMGYMDPVLKGTVLPLIVFLSMLSVDLILQHVWGMENGNQISRK